MNSAATVAVMTAEDAARILTERKHRGLAWKFEGPFVYGLDSSGHPADYESFDCFEAIAIAEKYQRDIPR